MNWQDHHKLGQQVAVTVATIAFAFVGLQLVSAAPPKLRVSVKLAKGGTAEGVLHEADDQGLVLEQKGKLHALSWTDLTVASAYQTRKQYYAAMRGGEKHLTAEDHFQLGKFLAQNSRTTSANKEFRKAKSKDPSYAARIKQTLRSIRRARERNSKSGKNQIIQRRTDRGDGTIGGANRRSEDMQYMKFSEEQHRAALKQFKEVGERVKSEVASDLVLLETRNFLIWTDWPAASRDKLAVWAEGVYTELCGEFGFHQDSPIWLGKCPIFCFKNQKRFDKFAKEIDGYDARRNLGYTRTANNYVHVVLRRLGDTPAEVNLFASTLIHETCHAFMHCYGSAKKLPAWMEEGLAEFMSERVLKDRCQNGENAVLLSRYYVKNDKPIAKIFEFTNSPPGEYYPIAHSLVKFLLDRNRKAFVAVINDIKAGKELEPALSRNFKGMTLKELEKRWRDAYR